MTQSRNIVACLPTCSRCLLARSTRVKCHPPPLCLCPRLYPSQKRAFRASNHVCRWLSPPLGLVDEARKIPWPPILTLYRLTFLSTALSQGNAIVGLKQQGSVLMQITLEWVLGTYLLRERPIQSNVQCLALNVSRMWA